MTVAEITEFPYDDRVHTVLPCRRCPDTLSAELRARTFRSICITRIYIYTFIYVGLGIRGRVRILNYYT